jgi:pyridoxal phosphate enzyme (YggS family)
MISKTINKLHSELPATVRLVAVSKFHPFDAIEKAYGAGQRIFAESRPQELQAKVRQLEAERPDMSDIQWHFIGHLQTNKLKMVLPYASLVQSVDSVRLLDAIESWAAANDRKINVLLEPHVAAEQTKQGFSPDEVYSVLQSAVGGGYPHIVFSGIMGMATFTDDIEVVKGDFAALRSIFERCRSLYPSIADDFVELSIGMSDDYPVAIEYGSTMVRIGSMIFGARS